MSDLQIVNIKIKNFRSISDVNLDCKGITTFVGQNDAGKSNILRALNLFFNGMTDHAQLFDFSKDYNVFAPAVVKKAPEIQIELTLILPSTHTINYPNLPNKIIWRKVWRKTGLHEVGCFRQYSSKEPIPSKSKVPNLLDRLVYNYVPAVKDKSYFEDLQGRLYDALSDAADITLSSSAQTFELNIQEQMKTLLLSVGETFQSKSEMKLPSNLRGIFEKLEFSQNGIPLSRRGDGIKIRHIPIILKFIAEKSESVTHGVRYHIWGFEEPENNVEMGASFKMAELFLEAAAQNYQVFITTHSPVFYSMQDNKNDSVKIYTVSKSDKNISKITVANLDDTHEEMGLMPLITPYVVEEQKRRMKAEVDLKSAKEKLDNDSEKPHIFVEGTTDERILKRIIASSHPGIVDKVIISACNNGNGGANAVKNFLLAWQLKQQHSKTPIKAFGIFDNDTAGKEAKAELNSRLSPTATLMIKAIHWTHTGKPIGIDDGFRLPVDLEYLYSDEVWIYAEQQGWLESRIIEPILTSQKS